MRGMVFGLALLVGAPAYAQYSGKILYDSKPFPPGGTAEFKKALRQASARTTLDKDGDVWNFHFVAMFRKQPGASAINLVFYDVTGKKREYVNVFEIQISPDQTSLLSHVVLSPAHGFKSGRRYTALVTRLIGGKEVSYAKTVVKLK